MIVFLESAKLLRPEVSSFRQSQCILAVLLTADGIIQETF